MPAPLVWLGIGLGTALVKAAYDHYSSRNDEYDNDDDDREYRQAAEQARKAEEQRLAREHQQRLNNFARSQLENLVDRHGLAHGIDEQLTGQALNNRTACKANLLAMYDSSHGNDIESERDRQTVGKLQQFYAQLEG